ncbi:hypothetical protein PSACC_00234 [Paramicrosporidium saccamoebae]|uniref:Uncharacterized protein n=1 Tax=Paramicrosporidium saccamoebae TaxID=1246581 RepID=A0A2H9TQK7_9FUNG|nr:hypothetical protein PSACC_00234 [Paramicrosporidium saccamoebae]
MYRYEHITMCIRSVVDGISLALPYMAIFWIIVQVASAEGRGLEWRSIWFVAPHIVLWAALKYRTVSHIEIYKWQAFDKCFKSNIKFWAYIKKILYREAGVTLGRNGFLPEAWRVFCCLIVSMLFPNQIALIYVIIGWVYPVIQTLVEHDYEDCSSDADNQACSGV